MRDLDALLAALPDGVTVVTDTGTIVADRRGPNMDPQPASETIIGRPVAALFDPVAVHRFRQAVGIVRAGMTPEPFDMTVSRWGLPGVLECRISIYDDLHVLALTRDVTVARANADRLAQRERELATIQDATPQVIARVEWSGRVVQVNRRWTELTGQSVDDACGFGYLDRIVVEDLPVLRGRFAAAHRAGIPFDCELRLRSQRGELRWAQLRTSPYFDHQGAHGGSVCTLVDVTDQRRLTLERDRLARVLDVSPDPTVITDDDGAVLYANFSADALLAGGTRFVDLLAEREVERYTDEVLPTARAEGSWTGELVYRGTAGVDLPMSVVVTVSSSPSVAAAGEAVRHRAGPEARPVELSHIARDITTLKEAERHLTHLATHDALTGLPNRIGLVDRLTHIGQRCRVAAGGAAVLFIDLDGFKDVNDRFGHDAGDEVLREVAARLEQAVRVGDVVARIGGDEFVVICDGVTTTAAACEIAQRAVDHVGAPVAIGGEITGVGASVGVALQDGWTDVPALLRLADEALYRAKRTGKGRVAVIDTSRIEHDPSLAVAPPT